MCLTTGVYGNVRYPVAPCCAYIHRCQLAEMTVLPSIPSSVGSRTEREREGGGEGEREGEGEGDRERERERERGREGEGEGEGELCVLLLYAHLYNTQYEDSCLPIGREGGMVGENGA